jgi:phosphate transport system substrate-binding protein
MRRVILLLLPALASLPSAACAPARGVVTLQGGGATFPAPLYKRWFLEYYHKHPKVRTNYLAIGSGAGVRQLSEGLVDFGASDEALTRKKLVSVAAELSKNLGGHKVELLQMPMTAGSIAVCYNVPGVADLRLSRKALIDVVLKEAQFWDDEAIRKCNPGVELPHLNITFVRRAESSGTTFNFTNHLNAIDSRWQKKHGGPGVGKSVNWPAGLGAKGNAGVAALISQTPGAIGYLESGYANLIDLPMAALQNKAGTYLQPTAEGARLALEEARFDDVLAATVPDPKGAEAYPIVTYTWMITRKKYDGPRDRPQLAEKLQDVLRYGLTAGQELSESLGYDPLPSAVVQKVLKVVDKISGHQTGAREEPRARPGTGVFSLAARASTTRPEHREER